MLKRTIGLALAGLAACVMLAGCASDQVIETKVKSKLAADSEVKAAEITVTAETPGDAPDAGRSIGEKLDDAGITLAVKRKLLDDPEVKGSKIDVDTRQGVVYLTGTVRSEMEKTKAVQLAKDTNGVLDVQPNLDVQGL